MLKGVFIKNEVFLTTACDICGVSKLNNCILLWMSLRARMWGTGVMNTQKGSYRSWDKEAGGGRGGATVFDHLSLG